MRKLIAASKITLDGMTEGPDGFADWVENWGEDYGLTPQIDACLLGGHMYPGYEGYWTAVARNPPGEPLPMTGKVPTDGELAWSRTTESVPHYVLTRSITPFAWPHTTRLRSLHEIASLKQSSGKDIYLLGGAGIIQSCLEAALLDEIRLIVHPVIAGTGKPLFRPSHRRHGLRLERATSLDKGRFLLAYTIMR